MPAAVQGRHATRTSRLNGEFPLYGFGAPIFDGVASRPASVTIVIAASTTEGLVLAADSRTTAQANAGDGRRFVIVTDHARKVFPLSPRVAAATHGASHFQGQTIAGLADRFRATRPTGDGEGVSTVIADLIRFLGGRKRTARTPAAPGGHPEQTRRRLPVLLIAGYDRDGTGKLFEITLPKGRRELLSTTDAPNYHWRGQGDAITRLMKGLDSRVREYIPDSGKVKDLEKLEYSVPLRDLSLRDAVDFVRFLGRVSIGIDRFARGTFGGQPRDSLVGGRLEMIAVTRDGCRWIGGRPRT